MQSGVLSGDTGFAGRAAERAVLRDVLAQARAGRPCAVHLHGEAGVGKTRLAAEACREAEEAGFQVLWARCLLLASASIPYLPLVSAFEAWLEQATDDDRQAVLEAAPAIAALVPSLGGSPSEGLEHLTTIHRALTILAARRTLVLVVDDVQWADASSRDVLSYVLAGMHGRMLVLLTARDEELAPGDPLHGWLADVRRLPAVRDLPLGRLTVEETTEQATLALGRYPDPALVAELFARTEGNAYFNELLLREVDPAVGMLPAESPEMLRAALLAGWHRMSAEARAVTRVLAVAGRPTSYDVLATAASKQVIRADAVLPALREAAERGIVELGALHWFRHPLLAEVLRGTLLPAEELACHRALVQALLEGPPGECQSAALARHYEGARMIDEAFGSYLLAAEEAGAVDAFAEEARLLLRAWELRRQTSAADTVRRGSDVAFALKVAHPARRGGQGAAAARIVDEARRHLDDEPDPLRRADLLRLWSQLADSLGVGRGSPVVSAALDEALEETRTGAPSAERAHVLAEYGYQEVCRGEYAEALRRADEAVRLAAQVEDPLVHAYALGVRAFVRRTLDDLPGCARDADEAYRVAVASGSADAVALARLEQANVLEVTGRWEECAELTLQAHLDAHRGGALGLAQLLGSYAAKTLTDVGRFGTAEEVLRRVLSVQGGGASALLARMSAMTLAQRQGRIEVASGHLARSEELDPGFREIHLLAHAACAEYDVAVGRPAQALEFLGRVINSSAVHAEPHLGDELLLLSARAAAALADSGERVAAVERLDRILERRAELVTPPFLHADTNPVRGAWQALFAAESALARGDGDPLARWQGAVTASEAAGLRYEHVRALLVLSRAMLAGAAPRAEVAALLRRAHASATDMGAAGLVAEAESLARMSRISLGRPAAEQEDGDGLDHAGLTRREREVLAHLVGGHTYAEIAASLFISQKTVGVHVSNLLRKTGTSNRVDAAAWAERRGVVPVGA